MGAQMRITNKIMQNNSLSNINGNKVSQDKLNTMMSTQKKITKPSDDPVIAIRALRLRSSVTTITQYHEKNVPDARSWLEVTEDSLKNVTDVLTDMISQVTKGSTESLTTSDREVIIEQLKELRDELAVRQIGVEIISAAEVHMTEVIFNVSDISALCYEGTNYMLLEIPHSEKYFEKPFHMIERLTSYYNVRPVIAHIERYNYLCSNDENLMKLRDLGCLFQIDAEILLAGPFLKKRAIMKLLREGFVDFVASDCHGDKRCQNLDVAFELIEKKIGMDIAKKLKSNPYSMLENKPLESTIN